MAIRLALPLPAGRLAHWSVLGWLLTGALPVHGQQGTRAPSVDGRVPASDILSASNAGPADGEWQLLSGRLERSLHTATYDPVRERMVVFGGLGPWGPYADTQALSLAGQPVWTVLSSSDPTPAARLGHSAIYDPVRDRIIVFSGTIDGPGMSDTWALNLAGAGSWTQLFPAGPAPSPRSGHHAVYDPVRDRMLVFGGSTDTSLWALSLSGSPAWTPMIPAGPAPRSAVAACYDPVRDRMLVLGASGVLTLWALPLAGPSVWSQVAVAGTPPAGSGYVAVYDPTRDRIVVITGSPGGRLDVVHGLALAESPTWTPIAAPGTGPGWRAGYSAIFDVARDRVVIFAGYNPPPYDFRRFTGEVWALSLAPSPSWLQVNPPAGPAPRVQQASMHDTARDRMLVFGGYSGSFLNDVWALAITDPPNWTRLLPTGSPPTARLGSSAVYDPLRDRMLVLGGYDGTLRADVWELTLGGSPAWTLLLPQGTPPAARWNHTAIHDPLRDRILIFGGERYYPPYFADVWELSLAGTPTWRQLSPQGAPPPARTLHSAIHDPVRDRMIIFGGTDGAPRSDTWALSLGDPGTWSEIVAPGFTAGPRYNHVAVHDWPRDRMLVFGGHGAAAASQYYDVHSLSLGGSPSWSRLGPTYADMGPISRDDHSAVFDPGGYRMVIYGGSNIVECNGLPEVPCLSQYLSDTWAVRWDLPVAVSRIALLACVDGDPLAAGAHVSTSPRLRLDLPGAAALDASRVAVSIDGESLDPGAWSLAGADEYACGGSAWSAGIVIRPRLEEGPHRVTASLVSADGELEGTFDASLHAADVLRILDTRVSSSPAIGGAAIAFTLTRAADCTLQIFDPLGRRVFARGPASSASGENVLEWSPDPSARRAPGVFFYRLSARSAGEQVLVRGRMVLLD